MPDEKYLAPVTRLAGLRTAFADFAAAPPGCGGRAGRAPKGEDARRLQPPRAARSRTAVSALLAAAARVDAKKVEKKVCIQGFCTAGAPSFKPWLTTKRQKRDAQYLTGLTRLHRARKAAKKEETRVKKEQKRAQQRLEEEAATAAAAAAPAATEETGGGGAGDVEAAAA